MVSKVSFQKSEWNTLPYKFMGGTPNISGVFGTKSALEYLTKVGLDNIYKHDKELLSYALKRTSEINNLTLYNPKDVTKQGSILLFSLKGIACTDLSALLDDMSGVATRAGMHCAEPIVSIFNKEGLTRASFYFYNTKEDVDVFIDSLKKIDKIVNKKQ
jgi:cysteine desulfurase/selenocysteine lyase